MQPLPICAAEELVAWCNIARAIRGNHAPAVAGPGLVLTKSRMTTAIEAPGAPKVRPLPQDLETRKAAPISAVGKASQEYSDAYARVVPDTIAALLDCFRQYMAAKEDTHEHG